MCILNHSLKNSRFIFFNFLFTVTTIWSLHSWALKFNCPAQNLSENANNVQKAESSVVTQILMQKILPSLNIEYIRLNRFDFENNGPEYKIDVQVQAQISSPEDIKINFSDNPVASEFIVALAQKKIQIQLAPAAELKPDPQLAKGIDDIKLQMINLFGANQIQYFSSNFWQTEIKIQASSETQNFLEFALMNQKHKPLHRIRFDGLKLLISLVSIKNASGLIYNLHSDLKEETQINSNSTAEKFAYSSLDVSGIYFFDSQNISRTTQNLVCSSMRVHYHFDGNNSQKPN